MQFSTLAIALAAAHTVAGHSAFTTLFVNDVNQGDGVAVRMNLVPDNATSPVEDLTSDNMACGFDGTTGVARVIPVEQSSKLSFLWREWADGSQPGAIADGHLGPCAVYMKHVSSAIDDTAAGDGWFKIWEETYDDTTSQWCTTKLIANNGFLSVNIPSDLAGGYYLVRPELLALHNAALTPPDPQFYTGCAQIFLDSTETSLPADTVSIPGYVDISNPSVLFNVWDPVFPYPSYGPDVYTSGSSATVQSTAVTTQTEGLLPDNAIAVNANWWGTELAAYSTQDACWDGSDACWKQSTACFDSAPPSGYTGCTAFETKCNDIDDACNAYDFNGPPNMGTFVTATPEVFTDIPAAGFGDGSETNTATASTSSTPATASTAASTSSDDTTSTDTSTDTSSDAATDTSSDATTTDTSTDASTDSSSDAATTSDTAASTDTPTDASTTTTTTTVSLDATCGGSTGFTCQGSGFGDCCSGHGWCGGDSDYCGTGCQTGFGTCDPVVEDDSCESDDTDDVVMRSLPARHMFDHVRRRKDF